MLKDIYQAKNEYDFKVVGGGAGAWQWRSFDDNVSEEVIDVIYEGYFEVLGPELFTRLLNGQKTEEYICEKDTAIEKTEPVCGASMLGIVELSRGCGRGCKFCTMKNKKMRHIDSDIILADIETNVANGIKSVVSGSEDFFRYGADGIKPDYDKLFDLLVQMRKIKGLSFMQIDHGNVTSVMQLSDEQLRELRKLLTWEKNTDYLWVNMGIESANGELVAKNCPGKIKPFRAEDWEDIVRQAAEKISRCGFFSVFSIILGLPGETPDDINRTIDLIEFLGKKNAVIFPIFYEPVSKEEIENNNRFTINDMRQKHLELYSKCYEINFKKVPKLFWDNQRAGGVGLTRRSLMRLLGNFEVFSWRQAFKRIGRQLAN